MDDDKLKGVIVLVPPVCFYKDGFIILFIYFFNLIFLYLIHNYHKGFFFFKIKYAKTNFTQLEIWKGLREVKLYRER